MNNLLSNAARYSAAGSDIRITAHVIDDCVEVQVSDQGTGVAPEDCERIFEKFYRGRHGVTLAVRGTGLGLAVARQLVEAHARHHRRSQHGRRGLHLLAAPADRARH